MERLASFKARIDARRGVAAHSTLLVSTLAIAVLLPAAASAQLTGTAVITADNVYELYCGDATTPTSDVGGSCNALAGDIIAPETYSFSCDSCIYIGGWSDDGVAQGLLAEINATPTIYTGDPLWEVCATDMALDGGISNCPGDPAPTVADLATQVANCNTGGLWTAPTVGEDNSSGGGVFPIVSGIDSSAEWIWYESGNCPGGNSPFSGGCDHDEYLIFRLCPPICGDNVTQTANGEDCDGTDDAACPGKCKSDCTCPEADHLKCYKVKDKTKLKGIVDLDSPQFGVEAGCKIRKAKKVCVPVDKDVVEATIGKDPVMLMPVDAPQLDTDFICYKVKCPDAPSDQIFKDQFAERQISFKKAFELCVPAIKTTPCEQDQGPVCFGDCPPGQVCEDVGTPFCDCVDGPTTTTTTTTVTTTTVTTLPLPCSQTPPACDGDCPPGQTCSPDPVAGCTCGTTTTTTTTLPGPPTCDPSTPSPQCDGTCTSPDEMCAARGTCVGTTDPCLADSDCTTPPCVYMDCECLPHAGLACGVFLGPPNCFGQCPSGQVCVDDSGVCQCQ